jgi:hypothetical protein
VCAAANRPYELCPFPTGTSPRLKTVALASGPLRSRNFATAQSPEALHNRAANQGFLFAVLTTPSFIEGRAIFFAGDVVPLFSCFGSLPSRALPCPARAQKARFWRRRSEPVVRLHRAALESYRVYAAHSEFPLAPLEPIGCAGHRWVAPSGPGTEQRPCSKC